MCQLSRPYACISCNKACCHAELAVSFLAMAVNYRQILFCLATEG